MSTNPNPGALRQQHVRRRFDRAAGTFDDADFVHRQAADGLFERMTPMEVDVAQVLDLGSATGKCSRRLAKRFPRGRVTCADLSAAMLRKAKSRRSRWSKIREVQADALRLPFADQSIDLIFANMLLPWIDDLPACFAEISRVLRKEGLFIFSTLGPDSLLELREAWRDVDDHQHINLFCDMHDIGDCLVQSGLRDPVLDVDYLIVRYSRVASLFADLTASGARNSLRMRAPGLTGRARFAAVSERLASRMEKETLKLTLELVFGHAWGGGPRQSGAEFHVGVQQIGRRRPR